MKMCTRDEYDFCGFEANVVRATKCSRVSITAELARQYAVECAALRERIATLESANAELHKMRPTLDLNDFPELQSYIAGLQTGNAALRKRIAELEEMLYTRISDAVEIKQALTDALSESKAK